MQKQKQTKQYVLLNKECSIYRLCILRSSSEENEKMLHVFGKVILLSTFNIMFFTHKSFIGPVKNGSSGNNNNYNPQEV
jgi:hypothetical protein